MTERDSLPPATGERRAIGGYHAQCRVAAGLILRALRDGSLDWVRLADPEAGRVDDIQIATASGEENAEWRGKTGSRSCMEPPLSCARSPGRPAAQPYEWKRGFDYPKGNGLSTGGPPFTGNVEAFTVFDDGNGPALYAGGDFQFAGSTAASNIAKWDGSNWSPLDAGTNGEVTALTVFDDGSGPALYINHVAKWGAVDK